VGIRSFTSCLGPRQRARPRVQKEEHEEREGREDHEEELFFMIFMPSMNFMSLS
jgi:hypothetical protein